MKSNPQLNRKAFQINQVLLVTVLLFVLVGHSRADSIDDYIKRQMRRDHVVSLSLAVVKDGRIIKAKGYGLANVELNAPATKDTVYDIASNAKQFTATGIMLLVEEGKLGLDDQITNYISDLPPTWDRVTIRHLLNHTSGIKDYTAVTNFWKLARSPISTKELVKMMAEYPPQFQPGVKWAYSNTGYHLLGEIVARVSGKSYSDFLRERIFAPLGMASTCVIDPKTVITNRASGYAWVDGVLRNPDYLDMSWAYGAGAVNSTATDMAKWDAALYTGNLLPPARLEQMWTPVKLNDGSRFHYGFGWQVYKLDNSHRLLAHSGYDPGFNSCIYRWIDDRITVIVLLTGGTVSSSAGMDSADEIAWGVNRRYIPRLVDKSIQDTAPQITARLKSALVAIIAGTATPEVFTPEMRKKQSLAEAEELNLELKALGRMKSFLLLGTEDAGKARQYRYRTVFRKETLLVALTLDEKGKISAMSVEFE